MLYQDRIALALSADYPTLTRISHTVASANRQILRLAAQRALVHSLFAFFLCKCEEKPRAISRRITIKNFPLDLRVLCPPRARKARRDDSSVQLNIILLRIIVKIEQLIATRAREPSSSPPWLLLCPSNSSKWEFILSIRRWCKVRSLTAQQKYKKFFI